MISERLVESVNAVTDLLKSNTLLRGDIEKLSVTIENKDAEIFNVSSGFFEISVKH
jgi:hypothetical protein